MALSEGELIGLYRIVACLSEGKYSDVFLCEDSKHRNRLVVLKISNSVELIERELRFYSSASHPSIPELIDSGTVVLENTTSSFLVTSYCGRFDLIDYISSQEKPPTVYALLTILNQISIALDYLHSKGFIHCDVKPTNVLIDENRNVYLIDFNAIRFAFSGGAILLTEGYYPQNLKHECSHILDHVIDSKLDDYGMFQTSIDSFAEIGINVNSPGHLLALIKNEKIEVTSLTNCLRRDHSFRAKLKFRLTHESSAYVTHLSIFIIFSVALLSYYLVGNHELKSDHSFGRPTANDSLKKTEEAKSSKLNVDEILPNNVDEEPIVLVGNSKDFEANSSSKITSADSISNEEEAHLINTEKYDQLYKMLRQKKFDKVSNECSQMFTGSVNKLNTEIARIWVTSEIGKVSEGRTDFSLIASEYISSNDVSSLPLEVSFDAHILEVIHRITVDTKLGLDYYEIADEMINDFPDLSKLDRRWLTYRRNLVRNIIRP